MGVKEAKIKKLRTDLDARPLEHEPTVCKKKNQEEESASH